MEAGFLALAESPVLFRFDRRLLGELPRLAWQTVLEVDRAVLDRRDVTPARFVAIHTFGDSAGRTGQLVIRSQLQLAF